MSALAVAAAAGVIAGAALQSAIGFGFALVAAPLLFAATTGPAAVGLLIVLGVEINLLTLLGEGRRPRPVWGDVLPVLAWSLPGALGGAAVLRALDDLALQLLVTAGVLAALVVNVRAARRRPAAATPHEPPFWSRPAAGLASGALSTATGMGGPPLVLLLMGRGLRPSRVRDTLTACFLGSAPVAVAALLATGTSEAVPAAAAVAALVPLAAVGHLAGRPVFARLARGRAYERVLTAVLLLTVAISLLGVLLSR